MAAVQKSFWSLFSDAKNLLAFFSPLSFHSFKKVPFVHSRAFNHFQPSLVDRGQNLCLFLLQPYSAEILRDNFALVIQSFHFFENSVKRWKLPGIPCITILNSLCVQCQCYVMVLVNHSQAQEVSRNAQNHRWVSTLFQTVNQL